MSPVVCGTPEHLLEFSDYELVKLIFTFPAIISTGHSTGPLWTDLTRATFRLYSKACPCQKGCFLLDACRESPVRGHPMFSMRMTGERDTHLHTLRHTTHNRERLRKAEAGMEEEFYSDGRCTSSVDRVTLTSGHQGPPESSWMGQMSS